MIIVRRLFAHDDDPAIARLQPATGDHKWLVYIAADRNADNFRAQTRFFSPLALAQDGGGMGKPNFGLLDPSQRLGQLDRLVNALVVIKENNRIVAAPLELIVLR